MVQLKSWHGKLITSLIKCGMKLLNHELTQILVILSQLLYYNTTIKYKSVNWLQFVGSAQNSECFQYRHVVLKYETKLISNYSCLVFMVDMDFNPPGTKIRISRAKLVKNHACWHHSRGTIGDLLHASVAKWEKIYSCARHTAAAQ